MADMVDETDQAFSRRGFLGWFWRGLAVLLAGEGVYVGLRLLASRKPEGSSGQIVTAGLVTDFPPGSVTPFNAERFFLVRFETGGFLALHSKCTHLACVVGWEKDRQVFACPCHGSIFEQDGSVANPPAPRPLDTFPIIFGAEGQIQVDTRSAMVRNAVNRSDLAYPPQSVAPSTAEATAP